MRFIINFFLFLYYKITYLIIKFAPRLLNLIFNAPLHLKYILPYNDTRSNNDSKLSRKKSIQFALGTFIGVLITGLCFLLYSSFNKNYISKYKTEKSSIIDNLTLTNYIDPLTLNILSLQTKINFKSNTSKYTIIVKQGSTLTNTLIAFGVNRSDTYKAIKSLTNIVNPRLISAGQKIIITLNKSSNLLYSINIPLSPDKHVISERNISDNFFSFIDKKNLKISFTASSGEISSSLFNATIDQNVPLPIIIKMIGIFSWDIDFQRDIHPGDKYKVIYEYFIDEKGERVKLGNILFASLTSNNKPFNLYQYEDKKGNIGYYDENGISAKKALMKTPIDGARLSSRFGKRKHPVLGYTRMHRGIDFAAPSGTPIMAAGDGRIEKAYRNGGYGKYIRIRHNGNYKTAYAHLKSYARGIRTGKYVKQRQIIGYVGSTGVSTGPHLHYEVHYNGKQVNPLKIKIPTGKSLNKNQLTEFNKIVNDRNNMFINLIYFKNENFKKP